jgi:hypothetical protein
MPLRYRFIVLVVVVAVGWFGLNIGLLYAIDTRDLVTARLFWVAQVFMTPLAIVATFLTFKDEVTGRDTDELWQALGALGWMVAVYMLAFQGINQTGQELLSRLWFLR